mmetsp:Transcript_12400/g.39680  ORF Transcript_12400/g.39680 Transcript_12400/m.39680 type:complete len:251 (-) Transcript_12400:1163-1915(-)
MADFKHPHPLWESLCASWPLRAPNPERLQYLVPILHVVLLMVNFKHARPLWESLRTSWPLRARNPEHLQYLVPIWIESKHPALLEHPPLSKNRRCAPPPVSRTRWTPSQCLLPIPIRSMSSPPGGSPQRAATQQRRVPPLQHRDSTRNPQRPLLVSARPRGLVLMPVESQCLPIRKTQHQWLLLARQGQRAHLRRRPPRRLPPARLPRRPLLRRRQPRRRLLRRAFGRAPLRGGWQRWTRLWRLLPGRRW